MLTTISSLFKMIVILSCLNLWWPTASVWASQPRPINYDDLYISGVEEKDIILARKTPVEVNLSDDLAALLRHGTSEAIEKAIADDLLQFLVDNEGSKTPLMYAAESNPEPLVIQKMIEGGANVNQIDSQGYSALDYAAVNNTAPLVLRKLVQSGANMQKRINLSPNYNGAIGLNFCEYSPLTLALIKNPRPEIVAELIALGFSPNETDRTGSFPINVFLDAHKKEAWRNNVEFTAPLNLENLETLIAGGAGLECQVRRCLSPLGQAVKNSNLEMTKYLLKKGADPNYENWLELQNGDPPLSPYPFTPLFWAVLESPVYAEDKEQILRLLLEYGADPNRSLGNNVYILDAQLAWYADEKLVKLLLKHGARASGQLNLKKESDRNNELITELYFYDGPYCSLCAAIREDFSQDTIKEIIITGTEGLKFAAGAEPLLAAIDKNRPGLLKMLIENGIGGLWQNDVNLVLAAIMNNSQEMLGLLLENGATVERGPSDCVDDCDSPLFICLETGRHDLAREMLSKAKKINLDIKNADGEGALHIMVNDGNYELIELMLARGANPKMKNAGGKTPLDIAMEQKESKIVALLTDRGGEK